MRRSERAQAGFSLIEGMISAAVLSVGLLGVVELHRTSIRGLATGRALTVASQIAVQRAEQIGGREVDVLSLPNCPTASDTVGCKLSRKAFASPKTCTAWLSDSDVPTPAGVDFPSSANVGYRRDIVIEAHPDTNNHNGSFLATISVCWVDAKGYVQELRSQKLLVPGA